MKPLDHTEIRYIVMGVWGVTTENNTELIAARVPTSPKSKKDLLLAGINFRTKMEGLICRKTYPK